ncbi:MAG TPA: hypothetical protein VD833_11035 [Vicinamibacterales bacterium]|nr:hypothetical protein [Vicinamibacterales bacterium]
MAAARALRDGLRRVNGAPAVLAGLFVLTLLVAIPLAVALAGMIEMHLGASLAAERAASGVDYDWWQEFSEQASGLGTTFGPTIIGFGAVLENLSNLLDNAPLAPAIAGATAAWMVLWSFLSGGVLDRYARNRPTRAAGFFAACGLHFWRFVRIGIVAWLAYAALFGWVHGWLFEDFYRWATRDLTVERTAFALRAACYLLFGILLAGCSLVFDYARIRLVVEDRRSAVGAILAALRFVRREPGTLTLYALNSALFLALVFVYGVTGRGATGSGAGLAAALLWGQLFILGRHYLKLLFYASQVSLFQSALAHADYTAAPALVWPDSPAAEAILNAEPAVPYTSRARAI